MHARVEISIADALMPNVSGKILVYKQWSVGYQRFDAINMVKKRKIQIKEKTNKLK
jgi:hypothetical protein